MTETSLKKLEQLIEAAPIPDTPAPTEERVQEQGDDPNTQITDLTVGELAERTTPPREGTTRSKARSARFGRTIPPREGTTA